MAAKSFLRKVRKFEFSGKIYIQQYQLGMKLLES